MSPVKMQQGQGVTNLSNLLDADFGIVELVAENAKVSVHKAVLAARSPVFAAMLQDMPDDFSSQLTIPDMEGPVLLQLVAYMYALKLPKPCSMAPQLLVAADRYEVAGLRAACEKLLATENVAN